MFGGIVKNTTLSITGEMHKQLLGQYPDFLAFTVCIFYAFLLGIGVKGSAMINSLLTIINLIVMAVVIIVGFYYVDGSNWITQKSK